MIIHNLFLSILQYTVECNQVHANVPKIAFNVSNILFAAYSRAVLGSLV